MKTGKNIKKNIHKKNRWHPKEECGIVGIFNLFQASNLAYLGLHALQHRGHESAGIVSADKTHLFRFAGMGKVSEVFSHTKLRQLQGKIAIGHNRYSTTGSSFLRNAQPIRMESRFGSLALAHNGNLTNAWKLRLELEKEGSIFQTTVDSEVIVHLMARSPEKDFQAALLSALSRIKGAFSLLILNQNTLYAIRDINGFRPLVLGKKNDGWVAASETCALDILDAKYEREIQPGEVLIINNHEIRSIFPFEKAKENLCIFEYIYFSRPDSIVFGKSVYDVRLKLGEILAKESYVEADVVMPVPDSSTVAALGFSRESKIPFHMGLIRSHYIGRTFIEPDQKIRDFGAKLKYNAIEAVVKNKKVVVVDDSIMRGTTQRKIIKMLRTSGAKEIHVRISSAPTCYACYYGIDIPTKKELIASSHNVEEIKKYLRVDSLAYLSIEGMKEAADQNRRYCIACFDGKYPVPLDSDMIETYSNQKDLFEEYQVEER
ncbi:MAG: amidophosphoribosyltransferase [Spirochaetia bacterium]|nr:amidophosphoribosyltransferase [Spirochaetia bacterium]